MSSGLRFDGGMGGGLLEEKFGIFYRGNERSFNKIYVGVYHTSIILLLIQK